MLISCRAFDGQPAPRAPGSHFVDTANSRLFVEHKNVLGLTVRGSVDNALDTNVTCEPSFYDRRTNPILFTESRYRFFGPLFTLSVSGNF